MLYEVITTESLAKMSAVAQLEYVKKYFMPYKNKLGKLEDVVITSYSIHYTKLYECFVVNFITIKLGCANQRFHSDRASQRQLRSAVGERINR